jgi:peptidoglycan/LPS O-acetylase OafA/YrhL
MTHTASAQGKAPREFIAYLHAFRGVAIILIIMTHLHSSTWFFQLVQNGSVFFVFISGYLFAHLYNEETTTRHFLVGKMAYLLCPYAVSVLPGLLYVYATQSHGNWVSYTVLTFATGIGHFNNAHWYVPFISLMFLSYPILRILQRRPQALVVATVIWLVVSAFTFRSAGNGNPLYSVLHFGSIFLAGMLMSRYRTRLEDFGSRWFWVIIPISMAGFFAAHSLMDDNYFLSMEQVLREHIVALNYSFIAKFLLIPVMLLVLGYLVRWQPLYAPLSLLADASFTLFFWHMYLINASNFLLQYFLQNSPRPFWINMDTIFAFQFFLCIALIIPTVIILRRILGRRSVYLTGFAHNPHAFCRRTASRTKRQPLGHGFNSIK